ncbi:MAG: hypothetical protein HEEMFOPI_01892 [Holosporales bacterium]
MRRSILKIVTVGVFAISCILSSEIEDRPINILSIDGGGVRGIVPAVFLEEIEKRMQKPLSNVFDVIAGTSTGGLLSLAFTVPDAAKTTGQKFTAPEIIAFYKRLSGDIFPKQSKVKVGCGLCKGAIYSADPLEQKLLENFKGIKFSELTTRVLITADDIKPSRSHTFFSKDSVNDSTDYFIRDLARATSAAPFYFSRANIQTVKNINDRSNIFEIYQDGGTKNNNPAELAFNKARELFPRRCIHLISLGTGESCTPLSTEKIESEGCCSRGVRVGTSVMDASSQNVHENLSKAAQRGDLTYRRIQLSIDQQYSRLDDSTIVDPLETIARMYVDEENKKIGGMFDEIEGILKQRGENHDVTIVVEKEAASTELFDERETQHIRVSPKNYQSVREEKVDNKSQKPNSKESVVRLGKIEKNEGGAINVGESFSNVRIEVDEIKHNTGGLINLGLKK